ncbi:MAG: energy transducer TonB [Candidatus Palauibacterales bacterium]|nr:energy transducer TonB [Candidatus Palauibacterales bacterium]MDP2530045.1 energy transducer TonB [Candidatus Palauibacterales bacterium]MDP2582827.1 energy transducer TonB [Candidatus Palauibacterales bacterium]
MGIRRSVTGATTRGSGRTRPSARSAPRAATDLRRQWSRALPAALVLSGVGHGLLLALGSLPTPTRRLDYGESGGFALVALPPEVRVPPPPPALRRPEPPAVTVSDPDPARLSAADRALDPAPQPLPPPPHLSPRPGFASQVGRPDLPPLLQDDPLTTWDRERYYPEDLRRAGIGGQVDLKLFVEPTGHVDQVSVVATSGHPRLDRAAIQIGRHMHFFPALNRDRQVGVWVAQTICFVVVRHAARRGVPAACPGPGGGS